MRVTSYSKENKMKLRIPRNPSPGSRLAGLLAMVAMAAGTLFGAARAQEPPAGGETLRDEVFHLDASDGIFEDGVHLFWTGSRDGSQIIEILKAGARLTYVAGTDSTYIDTGAVPGGISTYCVRRYELNSDDFLGEACDDGRGIIFAPAQVAASDALFEDRVRIQWFDRSEVEAGFRVYRREAGDPADPVLIATTAPNAEVYDDLTAGAAVSYEYCIAATDVAGAGGNESARGCDTGERGHVLPPGLVAATDGIFTGKVVLTWNDRTDLEIGYNIYRDGSLIHTAGADAERYEDAAAIGVEHEYCVRTVRKIAGNPDSILVESAAVCDAGIGGPGTLALPTSVAATDETFDDRVGITFEHNAGTADRFEILRDGEVIANLGAGDRSFDDPDIAPGIQAAYCVVAHSDSGGASAQVCDMGMRSIVVPPTEFTASDGDLEGGVLLQWKSSATAAVLFVIARDGQELQTVSGTLRSFTDTTVDSGTEHQYCIRAMSALGELSPPVCDTGSRSIAPPESVDASDEVYENQILVSWDDASQVESGFRIYREAASEARHLLATRDADRTSYADTTAATSVVYTYTVTAFDAHGESAGGADAGSRSLLAPASVEATDGVYEDRIVVTWEDESYAEDAYEITRTGGDGGPLVARLPRNTTSHVDQAIAFGVEYQYEVAAVDDHDGFAAAIDVGSTTILSPGSVSASDSYENQIVITWIDRSLIEDGYALYRDGALVTNLGDNIQTYIDSAPAAGSTHEYCVRAVAGSVSSADGCDTGTRPLPENGSTPMVQLTNPLLANETSNSDGFGLAVAVDGDLALVGSPSFDNEAGLVIAFQRDPETGAWEEIQAIDSEGANFGYSIAIDGTMAVIGAPFAWGAEPLSGGVYCYEFDGSRWNKTADNFDYGIANSQFGASVALQAGTLVIGAPTYLNRGRVFVYKRLGDLWNYDPSAQLTPPFGDSGTYFGSTVALDGKNLVVGSPGWSGYIGIAHLYVRNGDDWAHTRDFGNIGGVALDQFGISVAVRGDWVAIGAIGSDSPAGADGGKVFLYQYTSGVFLEHGSVYPSDGAAGNNFGRRIALGGNLLFATSMGRDRVYAFQYTPDAGWQEALRLDSESAINNGDVAADGARLLIGAQWDQSFAGAGYVYEFLVPPTQVDASDSEYANRVLVRWKDNSQFEDGFHVYRDGQLVETVGPNTTSYSDFAAVPGSVHEYCVSAYSEASGESASACDLGVRPPNGSVNGRIATRAGGAVAGAQVCISPSPGRATLFDGKGGGLRLDDAAVPASALTAELWVNSGTDDNNPHSTLLSYAVPGQARMIEIHDYRSLTIGVNGNGWNTGVSVADGQWHHVAMTWQSADGATRLYVDGALRDSRTLQVGAQIPSNGVLVLGQRQGVMGGGFDEAYALLGRLDEFRLWNTVRSADEIADSYHSVFTGSEDGLTLYWPMDEGSGPYAGDRTVGGQHATLFGGASWTDQQSPVAICAVTDLEGNYTISQLRYHGDESFKVQPALSGHQFEPAFKSIALSLESPVQNEIGFVDITSFTLSGTVSFKDTQCFVPNVEILVDDVIAGATGPDGRFQIAAQPGAHGIRPRLGDGVFSPARMDLVVDRDMAGLDFEHTTLRSLSGRIAGGCDRRIGDLTLKVSTENTCLVTEITSDHDYNLLLPPQKYTVQVTDVSDVPAALDRVDILRYFNDLGSRPVDLTVADQTLDFTYRAPLKIVVEGLPDPPCPTITDPETGITFPGVPVIAQGESVPLTIRVFEDYGDGADCPVDSGKVSIFDEVIDQADIPAVFEIKSGQVQYTTIANTPYIFVGRRDSQGNDRSYQKALTAVAEVEGRPTATKISWVLVTGDRPREGTFVSATTEEIPLLVVHDPPGDGSFCSVEEGQTQCTTIANIGMENLSGTISMEGKAGIKFQKGAPFLTTGTSVQLLANFGMKLGLEATQEGGLRFCTSTTEKFSTSANPSFIGPDGDVFLGVALNLLFAKTDVLSLDGCNLQRSQSVRFGTDEDKPFETTYLYTAEHIRDTVIPQLEDLRRLAPDSAAVFTSYIRNWQKHLDDNESGVSAGLRSAETNRSFSAGADYDYTYSSISDTTFTWSVKAYSENEAAVGFNFEESGNELKTLLAINMDFSYTRKETEQNTETFVYTYHLADNDSGDYFSLDVGTDARYDTPVFGLRSGRSSCPYESGTQPRDRVMLGIEPPVLNDVPAEEAATFTLSLTNASDSEETRAYLLTPIQTSNPGGAILRANGTTFDQGLEYSVASGQTQEVTMTVERGPRRYFYNDLRVLARSACDGGIADTVIFRVGFDAPCSDITLFEPQPGWTFNREEALAAGDTLRLTLADYQLQISERDSLKQIGAEYRPQGSDALPTLVREINRGQIPTFPNGDPKSVEIKWYVGGLNDGSYEVRAFTRCDAGRGFSSFASGRIDRKPPRALGVPQPADEILTLGDEIALTFDEAILCSSVNTQNVRLWVEGGDQPDTPIEIEVTCDGRTVVLTPVSPGLGSLEGKTLTARVTGIRDLAGNPMEGPAGSAYVEWTFQVQRSRFAWAQASLIEETGFGDPGVLTGQLVNGQLVDLEFDLENVPDWLTPSPVSGSIRAGESKTISFAIDPALAIGTFEGTVEARVRGTQTIATLTVRVEVRCIPPTWTVRPEDFEQNMSAVVRLSLEGQISADTNDVVAAFVGNSLRGVARVQRIHELGDVGMAFLTIGSNRRAGERIRFRIWDDSACRLYRTTNQIVNYSADQQVGSPASPLTLVAVDVPTDDAQTIEMSVGWNWFSLNLGQVDMSVDGVLADLNPRTGDLVKARNVFSQFDETAGWLGSLTEFDNRSMFAIKLTEPGTVIHEGEPRTDAIPLANKWNWISFLPLAPLPVAEAFVNLTPSQGDVVKSQDAFAQVVSQGGQKYWIGSLAQMEPGRGYKLYLEDAALSGGQLVYAAAPLARSGEADVRGAKTIAAAGATGPGGTRADASAARGPSLPPFDPMEYQYNMTVTGSLAVAVGSGAAGIEDGDAVVAYVGDSVRGIATVQYVPGLEKSLFFLMIHSNATDGEIVTFRVFEDGGAQSLSVDGTVPFSADRVLGRVDSPFLLTVLGPDGGGMPSAFELMGSVPNPLRADRGGMISYGLPATAHVRIAIFDLSGREIATLVDGTKPAGRYQAVLDPNRLASGIYFCSMRAGGFTDARRLIVVK